LILTRRTIGSNSEGGAIFFPPQKLFFHLKNPFPTQKLFCTSKTFLHLKNFLTSKKLGKKKRNGDGKREICSIEKFLFLRWGDDPLHIQLLSNILF
jgi:hypothetical protein